MESLKMNKDFINNWVIPEWIKRGRLEVLFNRNNVQDPKNWFMRMWSEGDYWEPNRKYIFSQTNDDDDDDGLPF
jgi:hypothetical protein